MNSVNARNVTAALPTIHVLRVAETWMPGIRRA